MKEFPAFVSTLAYGTVHLGLLGWKTRVMPRFWWQWIDLVVPKDHTATYCQIVSDIYELNSVN